MNTAVLGAGAWGTAMAIHLARRGHTVTLVPRRAEQALAIAGCRENREYLPGHFLDASIQLGLELRPALMEADLIFLACPSGGLATLAEALAPALDRAQPPRLVVTLCKGLDRATLRRPSELVLEAIPGIPVATLTGPSNAEEVARGLPSAVVLAGTDAAALAEAQPALSGPTLRAYTSPDLAGAEIGGALKNVYALGSGLCDGLELGSNAKAALLTRSIHEMVRLGTALGGKAETFLGLSGVGDLMATAHGSWSRNRGHGEELARDFPAAQAGLARRRTVVEGVWATRAFAQLADARGVDAPILSCLDAILAGRLTPSEGVGQLMGRDLRSEA
jgi:glycerol-3-phosphate dehydrogenase (NAD(P)+)